MNFTSSKQQKKAGRGSAFFVYDKQVSLQELGHMVIHVMQASLFAYLQFFLLAFLWWVLACFLQKPTLFCLHIDAVVLAVAPYQREKGRIALIFVQTARYAAFCPGKYAHFYLQP